MTLSQQIEEHLASHLEEGRQPCRLTLQDLAGYYRVSLMPVRVAVQALVEQGLLIRGDNKRLEAVPPRRRSSRSIQPRTQPPIPNARNVDRELADFVIQQSLAGAPSFLREESTASRFGVGRTVVRRVLGRLAGERLIEHLPRRGWRIRPYSEQDMLDYLDIRETLELRALQLARPHLDRNSLEQLLAANSEDNRGRPRLDNSLHRHWIARSRNRYIQDFFEQHGIYFQALFDRAALDADVVRQRAAEHRAILRALLDRDWSRARRELSQHIRVQRPNVNRMFQEIAGQRRSDD